jgi:hypothetical protein
MIVRYAIIVGCVLAGALGASCGDIAVVPPDGGAGKGGGSGGRGGGAAGTTAGAAGTGLAGAAGTGPAGAGGGGAAGTNAGTAGTGPAGAGGSGGGAACRRELLTNGEFDLAASSWNAAPQGTRLVRRFDDADVASHQVTPQSGQYVLRLGAPSTNYVVHYVEQYANIPTGALEISISGYVQIRTDEPPDDVFDEAYIVLFDEALPSSPLFRSAPRWSNLTQASSWMPFSFPVNVASIAGKQMVFRIIAELDTSVPTYFYFDTLSVAVTRCSP